MTQQEFFAHTQLHPDQINIWYDDTQGPPYTLRAITIPVLDTNTPVPKDNSEILAGLQQVTIPLSIGGNITLEVVAALAAQSRPASSLVDIKYYYYTIKPLTISAIGNLSIYSNSVIFAPATDSYVFDKSNYNVTKGIIQASRKSTYIMEADRYKIGTLANPAYTGPLNINELLTGSAVKADVQDSNYTSTPWINARYEGSKTDRVDYKTEPAVTGRFFDASEFPSGSTQGQIDYLISSSQVLYKPYFYTGIGDTPGFQLEYSGFVNAVNYSSTVEQIRIAPEIVGSNLTSPKPGDLLQQDFRSEIFRVNAVGIISTNPLVYTLFITRGYFGEPQTLLSGEGLNRVSQVQVFSVEGSKLSGVPKGRLLIKETGKILKLDSLGYVINSI